MGKRIEIKKKKKNKTKENILHGYTYTHTQHTQKTILGWFFLSTIKASVHFVRSHTHTYTLTKWKDSSPIRRQFVCCECVCVCALNYAFISFSFWLGFTWKKNWIQSTRLKLTRFVSNQLWIGSAKLMVAHIQHAYRLYVSSNYNCHAYILSHWKQHKCRNNRQTANSSNTHYISIYTCIVIVSIHMYKVHVEILRFAGIGVNVAQKFKMCNTNTFLHHCCICLLVFFVLWWRSEERNNVFTIYKWEGNYQRNRRCMNKPLNIRVDRVYKCRILHYAYAYM